MKSDGKAPRKRSLLSHATAQLLAIVPATLFPLPTLTQQQALPRPAPPAVTEPAPEEPSPGPRTLAEVLAESPSWGRTDREPHSLRIEQLRSVAGGWSVEVAYGSWCSDSAREVPRLIAILKRMGEQAPPVRWISIDRAKSRPAADVRRLRIERVPTFVVFRNESEIGRIVERAEPSIEETLLRILSAAGGAGASPNASP